LSFGRDFVPPLARNFRGFRLGNGPELLVPERIVSATSERAKDRRADVETGRTEDRTMLSWVVTFLVIALIAGILGFGGIAGVSIEIAKTIFFIAIVLFLVSAVVGLARGRTRV
jgi:uncharacterized membrane protein YtjA (UPF0391 family)